MDSRVDSQMGDMQTNRMIYRQTERRTDRQTEKHKDKKHHHLHQHHIVSISPTFVFYLLILFSINTHFNTLKKNLLEKNIVEKVKLLKMSYFTFSQDVFCAICISKFFNSHFSVVFYSFFKFGTVSEWYSGMG